MNYQHIFFDLDRTLWDFDANSHETLLELCDTYRLNEKGVLDYEEFIAKYKDHNEKLWDLYRLDKISQKDLRRERFQMSLKEFGINDFKLSERIGEEYIAVCPRKSRLYPYTFDVLEYLKNNYILHIITNGFDKTQHIKLEHSKLKPYFDKIITSEKLGVKKPNPAIFIHALDLARTTREESVYIGDNLVVDILACEAVGIDGVYFNPDQNPHNNNVSFEISCLSQLMEIF